MATIPLSWDDPMFSNVTNSTGGALPAGGTLSNASITDFSGDAVVGGFGSFNLDHVRIDAREGVRIAGSGDITISNSYIETTGEAGDHADGIQAYAPGGTGNVTVKNTTIVGHANGNDTAGMFVADEYSGTFTYENVVFEGGQFGLRIAADTSDINVSLKDVYFVGTTYLFQEVNAPIHITQWENVRSATIVNGQLVPGDLIPPPWPVEGSSAPTTPTAPTTPSAPDAPTIASFSDDSGVAGDKITNDNTLELKGTAAAGSTVKIFDGSTQLGTTTASSTGSWDYITKVLTDAKHTLTATSTNASGQMSATSSALAVTVDTKAPTAPTIGSHTVNSGNQMVMSGNAEASSVVKVFDGTTQIGSATANSSGVWTYTTAALAAGSHSLMAKAVDAAGNTGAASTAVTASIGTGTSAPATPTSPTSGHQIESAGATTLVESGGKYYLNSSTGSGPSLKNHGVDFVDGSDGTWAPIAAEKTATGYQVVWKEGGGYYTAWNTDNNGNYVSHVGTLTGSASGGYVSGSDAGLKSLETSFHQDLNGDGQIGTSTATTPTSPTPSKVVESDGATTLVEGSGKYYLNGSSGSGPSLKSHGVDFVDGSDGTWAPISAEKTATGYQVAWKEGSGVYTAWNTDNNGNYVSHVSTLTGSSSGGFVSGTDSGLKSLEASFHQDLNGDGQIGASTTAASSTVSASTSQVAATSGSTFVASTGNTTLKGTSGNDTFVGSSQADTFVFGANFGQDVIKGFTASGPAHDTIEFSKGVFDSFASVLSHAAQSGQDVVVATGSDTLTLKNTKLDALNSHDFHFA